MRTLFLLSIVALLSGCAMQSYQARPLDPAKLAKSYEARTLDSAELHQFIQTSLGQDVIPWPPKSWSGKMLTLAAFYYSPDLDAARAKWGTAKAGIVTAAQRPNPTLQLPFQHTTGSSGNSPWTFGLGLDIPIETAGKRGYRIAQAQQLSDAARFSIGNVAWQVRSRLRAQLLKLYTATQKTAILKQQIEAQSQIVKMLEQRLAVGEASATAVNQQRIALIQSRTDLANAQKQREDARAQVASAIGVPVSALDGIPISFAEFDRIYPDIPMRDAQRQAILNRADLLSALAQYQASQEALQLAIANQYPDIHLGPGYLWDQGATKIAFGASGIALPILNQNQGPIAEAKARRAEAEANVISLQAQAINQTDQALVAYHAALNSLSQSEALVSAQQQQLSSAQNLYRAGETDRLMLTLAHQALFTVLLARQNALMQVQQSLSQLEDAIERPLDGAIEVSTLPDPARNAPANQGSRP
ncbi:TolC family protein [Sulfuriferula sp.]|uniref:TolC family protein n=1 Tax=Sulfuriferula sp. TaxID=2025307 RepID=UPI00272F4B04|nr:TolC family protein [Sulfuriferula sp.]MDP2024634.1 TolC family protein [Sulfuriferula sp.]